MKLNPNRSSRGKVLRSLTVAARRSVPARLTAAQRTLYTLIIPQ